MTNTDSHEAPDRNAGGTGEFQHDPVPLGATARTKIERGDAYSAPEIYDLSITVKEVLRGAESERFLREQGLNDISVENGYELLPILIRFGYNRRGRGFGSTPYFLGPAQFGAVSENGKTAYAKPSDPRQPAPGLMEEPFTPGQEREGWILLQAPVAESHPLLVFNREYNEGVYGIWGLVWFQLSQCGE